MFAGSCKNKESDKREINHNDTINLLNIELNYISEFSGIDTIKTYMPYKEVKSDIDTLDSIYNLIDEANKDYEKFETLYVDRANAFALEKLANNNDIKTLNKSFKTWKKDHNIKKLNQNDLNWIKEKIKKYKMTTDTSLPKRAKENIYYFFAYYSHSFNDKINNIVLKYYAKARLKSNNNKIRLDSWRVEEYLQKNNIKSK